MVAVSINNLTPGDFVLRVHNYGDTSDQCKNAAGKQWAELYKFSIKDKKEGKEYRASFKRYDLALSDEFNILGRAVSLAKASDGYDTDNVLSCEPIGLTSQIIEQISGPEPTKTGNNNFVYG
uniref:Uncharacterized protein n=1 Tax=Romanomermis culicivorax TaxID=13658 RepID=A0A915IMB5_ROMCU